MTTGYALEQRVRRGTKKRVSVNQYSLLMFAEDFKQGRVLDPEMVAVRPVPCWGYGMSCDRESRVKLWVVGKDLNLKLSVADAGGRVGKRTGYAENRLELIDVCAEGEINKLWSALHCVRHRMVDKA